VNTQDKKLANHFAADCLVVFYLPQSDLPAVRDEFGMNEDDYFTADSVRRTRLVWALGCQ